VKEHLPPDNFYYYVYSSVFGVYELAKFSPAKGWSDIYGEHLKAITHWWDQPMPMPFPITRKLDDDAAKLYEIDNRSVY
jgi:hypothetical protein